MIPLGDFFPGRGPSLDRFWRARPGGPDFSLDPRNTNAYDLMWSAVSVGGLAAWARFTGRGVSLNTALGGIFFPTKELITYNQYGRAYAHTYGAAPSFTGGVFRTIGRAAIPLAAIDLAVTGSIAQHEMTVQFGTGIRGSPGSVAPSGHLVEGQPYWESMTLESLLPWNWG